MRILLDTCMNILAAEYLFKTSNKEEFNKRAKQLAEIQLNDDLMDELAVKIFFKRDCSNIAIMFNQGYFDEQLKTLTEFLDENEGKDCLANHPIMSMEDYLEALKKGEIKDDNN